VPTSHIEDSACLVFHPVDAIPTVPSAIGVIEPDASAETLHEIVRDKVFGQFDRAPRIVIFV